MFVNSCNRTAIDYNSQSRRNYNFGKSAKKTLIPSSGDICPSCFMTVAKDDVLNGEDIPGGGRKHKACLMLK